MSEQQERRVTVTFFGQDYTLVTGSPQEEVDEVVELVRSHFHRLVSPNARVIPEKLAILACLNMASDCVRLRRELERCRRGVGESARRLSKRIESCLEVI